MKKTLLTLFILLIIFGILLPFVPVFLWAFSQRWFYPDVLPEAWGVRAWTYVFGIAGRQVASAIGTSLTLSSLTALVSVIVAIPAARVLGLYEKRYTLLLQFLFVLPILVPSLSVAMGLHL